MSVLTLFGTEPKSQVTCCQLKKHIYNIHREQQNLCSSLDNGVGIVVVELRRSKTRSKYRSIVQSMSPVQSPESSFYTDPF